MDDDLSALTYQMDVAAVARSIVEEAERQGLVLTIEQVPLKPFAMGHYETVVSIRPARQP